MQMIVACEWPSFEMSLDIPLDIDQEPELCQKFWEFLESPQRMFCRHPVSTGYEFSAEGRPPRHPADSGSQVRPIGRRAFLLSELEPGSVTYAIFGGYGGLSFCYGKCTEPLPSRGAVISLLRGLELEKLKRIGSSVMNAQIYTHTPVIMKASRKE